MQDYELEELWKRKRSQNLRLIETGDLTGQLAEALERKDQISVEMLLSMRAEPLRQLQELQQGIQTYLLSLPPESAIRGQELLNGAPAAVPREEALAGEVAKFRRNLAGIVERDRRMSLTLGGRKSFYNLVREHTSAT